VTTLKDFSLIIVKNESLLDSIKDYFYENLLHGFNDDRLLDCKIENIDDTLKQVKTKYAVVIQEGKFFFDHIDNNFLKIVMSNIDDYSVIGHVLDRKERYYQIHQQQFILNVDNWKKINCPNFNHTQSDELVVIKRSTDNFHDDHTPLWIEQTKDITSHNRLKFGGYVISEMLKHNFKIRPFNESERHVKKFVYYNIEEQVKHMLGYEQINPHSYYYPISTATRIKHFKKQHTNYISVANGVESLKRLIEVYKNIKTITFYDTSITALIFTELLIKNFNSDYKKFVQDFDMIGGQQWSTLNGQYEKLDEYDISELDPILKHIRENVNVRYCIGDITRSSIVENVEEHTLVNLSNVFDYNFNLIRKSEYADWCNKIANSSHKFEVLR
jgi:hypothetical protein